MVPQNNYTLKHNSFRKSSSWRGAHWLLAYGKFECTILFQQTKRLMRYEELKTHIAEFEWRQKHTQTKSVPPVLFPENLWENETLQLKPGDRQRGSTTNNIDILTLDVCLPPRIFISFAMISNNRAITELHPNSRILLAHIHKKFSSGAHGG